MQTTGRTVLVVEDDPDNASAICDVLTEEGYLTHRVADGAAAWSYLTDNALPQLIVLDLMMPKVSGWELAEAVRGDERLSQVPLLVLSADRQANDTVTLFGVNGCLSKPVDLDELVAEVARCAGGTVGAL